LLDYTLTQYGLGLSSMASPSLLGTPDHIVLQDEELLEKIAAN